MTAFSIDNAGKPAPKWYRNLKRVTYLLVGSSVVSGTLSRIGVADADALLIMGWMTTVMEVLAIMLGNGEVYAPKPSDQ